MVLVMYIYIRAHRGTRTEDIAVICSTEFIRIPKLWKVCATQEQTNSF